MHRFILVMMCSTTLLWAQGPTARGWYIGAAGGTSDMSDLTASDLPSSFHVDDEDTTLGLFGGYQFNRYLSVEGGIFDFGELEFENAARTESTEVEVDGFKVMAVGYLPVHPRVSLMGKAGIFRHDLTEEFTEDGIEEVIYEDDDESVTFEAGVAFRLFDSLFLDLSYSWNSIDIINFTLSEDGELDAFSRDVEVAQVGLRYRF